MRHTKMEVRIDEAARYFKSKKSAKIFADLLTEALICFESSKLFKDEKVKITVDMFGTDHLKVKYSWGAQIERDENNYANQ